MRKMSISVLLFLIMCGIMPVQTEAVCYKRPIVIEGNWNWPPFFFINDQGKPDGYSLEMITTILHRLRMPYVIKVCSWRQSMADISSGKADVTSMIYSNARSQRFRFGLFIRYESKCVVRRKSDPSFSSINDLKGKSILVEEGSRSWSMLEEDRIDCHIVTGPDVLSNLRALSQGRGDGVFCNLSTAQFYLMNEKMNDLVCCDIGLAPQQYQLAGNSESLLRMMNQEMYLMKKDGTYDRISQRWFRPYQPARVSPLIYMAIAFLLLLALCLYVIVHILRKRVRRTQEMLESKSRQTTIALYAGEIMIWSFDVVTKRFYNVESNIFPLEGLPFEDELLKVHPDDRELFSRMLDEASSGVLPGESVIIRVLRGKEASVRYVSLNINVEYAHHDQIARVIGTRRDVTDVVESQRKIEENARKVQIAVRSADLMYWEYDCRSGKLMLNNDTITGQTESSPMKLADFYKIVHSDDIATLQECEDIMTQGINRSFSVEIRMLPADGGSCIYGTIVGTPFHTDAASGLTDYYVGVGIDHTALTLIQQRLEEEKVRAQESDRLKSEFLANMSHEIRTPLNAIVGFSSVFCEVDDDKDREQCIAMISKNSELLLGLVNDILDLSKIEAGVITLSRSEMNLSEIFAATYDSLQHLSTKPDVAFLYDPPYARCMIEADSHRIMQILTNFVTNAFKYTERGHVRMGYTCEGGGVRLFVEDTGSGIPPEYQTQIFDRFEKLGSFKQGAGLGLSICKGIADKFGGRIGVDSDGVHGSTFWFWLPCEPKVTE